MLNEQVKEPKPEKIKEKVKKDKQKDALTKIRRTRAKQGSKS